MVKRAIGGIVTAALWTALAAGPAAATDRPAPAPGWRDGVVAAARLWLGERLAGWVHAPADRDLTIVTEEEGQAIDPNGLRVDLRPTPTRDGDLGRDSRRTLGASR